MIDEQTGLAFNEARLRIVNDVYTTITQDGLSKVKAGGAMQGLSMAEDDKIMVF